MHYSFSPVGGSDTLPMPRLPIITRKTKQYRLGLFPAKIKRLPCRWRRSYWGSKSKHWSEIDSSQSCLKWKTKTGRDSVGKIQSAYWCMWVKVFKDSLTKIFLFLQKIWWFWAITPIKFTNYIIQVFLLSWTHWCLCLWTDFITMIALLP